MFVLMEIEETVETVEGVLVNMVGGRYKDSIGVTTAVEGGHCNKVEGTAGKRDGDAVTDTIAVGTLDKDKDDEVIIDTYLKGSCKSCSVGLVLEECMQKPGATRKMYRTVLTTHRSRIDYDFARHAWVDSVANEATQCCSRAGATMS
jgi:hypothetical protein